MEIFKKEHITCSAVEYKYVNAMVKKYSNSLSLDLDLFITLSRFEKTPTLFELCNLLHREEKEIECSLISLSEIGFLSLT